MKKLPVFNIRQYIILSIASIISIFVLYSCANIARPGGGPYDEVPPVFVSSKPGPNQIRVNPKKVELIFDENIKLDNPFTKVIVSPPQKTAPIVKSNSKTVTVELKDTLKPNTTYTIDFTDAIRDNNEGNILESFSVAFSTGDIIDTMKISGTILNAENLEPEKGVIVGIHSDLSDSAFVTKPFDRISKSDEAGKFNIYNITPGEYKIYALKDINNNYMFDLPGEDIAFLDSIIIPSVEIKMHADTVSQELKINTPANKNTKPGNLVEKKDSIRQIPIPHYYPDNIVLLTFNENKKNIYLEKSERELPEKINIYFSAPLDSAAQFKPINFPDKDWGVIEESAKNDTVMIWIKDSLAYKMDTLKLAVTHLYTDTLKQNILKTDTLNLVQRVIKTPKKKEEKPKKKGKDEAEQDSVKIEFLTFNDNMAGSMDIGVRPKISLTVPFDSIDKEKIHVQRKVDTIFVDQDFDIRVAPGKTREFEIRTKLTPGEQYKVALDSTAVSSIYGLHNNSYNKTFTVKKVEEYSGLLFQIHNLKNEKAYIEILNNSDKPLYKAVVKNGEAKFPHLKPGTYYARIVLDKNGNGVFDTGDYGKGIQPDEVIYYSSPLELKANWQVKQEWDIRMLPTEKQKPLEITKNKPKEKVNKNRNQENTNNKSSNNSYGGGNISGGIRR